MNTPEEIARLEDWQRVLLMFYSVYQAILLERRRQAHEWMYIWGRYL